MEPAVLQITIAALGVLGAVFGGIVGAYVAVKATVAVHESRITRLEEDVKGLREARHHVEGIVTGLQAQLLKDRP